MPHSSSTLSPAEHAHLTALQDYSEHFAWGRCAEGEFSRWLRERMPSLRGPALELGLELLGILHGGAASPLDLRRRAYVAVMEWRFAHGEI